MGNLLNTLSFLQPIILLAFISLPLLWLLLRVTPPPPKIKRLPTFRFIKDLIPQDHTSRDTPLWLLLLRLLAISLIILGFAGPVLNAQSYLKGQSDIRLVIDNSWASAANWDSIIEKATHISEEAARKNKTVQIFLMAEDEAFRQYQGRDLSAKEALSRLKTLEPKSWSPDSEEYLERPALTTDQSYHSYYLSSGIAHNGQDAFFDILMRQGGLDIYLPSDSNLPYLLKLAEQPQNLSTEDAAGLEARISALSAAQTKRALTVQALDSGNAVIDSVTITPNMWQDKADTHEARIDFDLPPELITKIQRLQLRDQKTAGSTLIVDPTHARKDIGIVQIKGDKDEKAYIGSSFYLQRALAPFADMSFGSLSDVLAKKPAIIILPDDVATLPEQLNTLQNWLENGGILIRFAGPRLLDAAEGTGSLSNSLNQYLPVPLRRGGRSMGSQLSWDEAQDLKSFSDSSLFYGLPISEDIQVRQMVLAEPGDYLDKRSWARLEDGTPLVTYEARENGLIVLFHTAATPDWSSLPLSGLYVSMLKRIIDLSAMPRSALANLSERGQATLNPVYTLSGYGGLLSPAPYLKPISASLNAADIRLTDYTPAGLYAGQGLSKTLNLSDTVIDYTLLDAGDLPFAIDVHAYQSSAEQRPGSAILFIALLVLLADVLACFVLMGINKAQLGKGSAALIIALIIPILSFTSTAQAQETYLSGPPSRSMADYANNFYLAYIKTGDGNIDTTTQTGLEELALTLNRRTSAEPSGIVGLDINQDTISFFPIIYWPVIMGQARLPADTIAKVQNYLDNGGMILFDLQSNESLDEGQTNSDLKRLIGPLNVAPLEIVPEEHALRRSFYLLDEFPGAIPDNPLWVERREDTRIADAASILIGSNRWAEAWADGTNNNSDEMAMRFGVNLIMYALTGNYKTDQVHVKHILERLGE